MADSGFRLWQAEQDNDLAIILVDRPGREADVEVVTLRDEPMIDRWIAAPSSDWEVDYFECYRGHAFCTNHR